LSASGMFSRGGGGDSSCEKKSKRRRRRKRGPRAPTTSPTKPKQKFSQKQTHPPILTRFGIV
jgi:hypothetical protein